MSDSLTVSREVLLRLQDVKRSMESLLGKEVSLDQVLIALIDVYTKGATIDAGRIDMLIDIWDKLQNLEKRVSLLEQSKTQTSGAAIEEHHTPEQATTPSEKPSPQAQRGIKQPSPVITPKPVQPAPQSYERTSQQQDSFLKFIEDVVVYPLDKIRKPREQIDKLIKENVVSIMSVGGQELLVHLPSYQAFLKKLPIPISDKQKLSQRERKLLQTLSDAGLVYEDATTGLIKSV